MPLKLMRYAASSASSLLMVITALRVPATAGVKLMTRFPVLNAETVVGEEPTAKSGAAGPVMFTDEMFNVLVVPRFSIVKVVGVIVLTGELAVKAPPFTMVVDPC